MLSGIKSINRRFLFFTKNSPYFVFLRKTHNYDLYLKNPGKKMAGDHKQVRKKDSPYYIENSLRKVYPYYYKHTTYCKGRWVKKNIMDLYLDEFALYPKEIIERRILNGVLRVNGNKVGLDYTMKNGDLLTSVVHRHELPVLATPIKTIFEDEDLLVVDKPPSIPVHPSGMYRYNTILSLLSEEHNNPLFSAGLNSSSFSEEHNNPLFPEGLNNPTFSAGRNNPLFTEGRNNPLFSEERNNPLFSEGCNNPLVTEECNNMFLLIHRLDRLTSGVLILAKAREKSRKIHEEIVLRKVEKEYLCRVEGNFPDEIVVCDAPLKRSNHKLGVSLVDSNGKPSQTEFQKLSFNCKSSVVLCKPKTGRTHQIRAHLQYLGYPIVNDPLYNSYAFGPQKGKHGKLNKSIEQLLKDLLVKHTLNSWLEETPFNPYPEYEKDIDLELKRELDLKMDISTPDLYASMDYGVIDDRLLNTVYKKDPNRITHHGEDCYNCMTSFRDPKPSNLVMFLHAFRYKGEDWEFKTEMPGWAQSDWDVM